MSSDRYLNEAALDPPPETSWGKLLATVPPGSRVLDVGCGHGAFAAALRRLRGCQVTGIEQNTAYAGNAKKRCDELFVGDVSTLLRDGALGKYDVVVASDVLEHLLDPRDVLDRLRSVLDPGGVLLASIPNVTHLSVVVALAQGRFPRTDAGLLDATHIQFYGQADALELFDRAHYAARVIDRVVVDPRSSEFRTDLKTLPGAVLEYLDQNKNATTYQFIVRAVPDGWAKPADRDSPEPTASPPSVSSRLVAEVAALEKTVQQYHVLAMQKDQELRALHERIEEYDALASEKDEQLRLMAERLMAPRRTLSARERELSGEIAILSERRSPERARLAARSARGCLDALRVLYVADDGGAPFRYRCVQGCTQLREMGVVANVASIDQPDLLESISRYSLVVLFRLPWSKRAAEAVDEARRSGPAVAFEVDDLVFDPQVEPLMPFLPHLGPEAVERYRRTFVGLARTLDASDFCITSTEALARRVRARGTPVVVHPNLLPPEYVRLARVIAPVRRALLHQPLIGYLSGSNTHDGDLASVAGGIAEALRNRPELSLVMVGHVNVPRALQPFSHRIVRVPYVDFRVYPWLMARCRAVLAPIEAVNDFTNGKSPLKVFEAGIFGIPTVASPIASYRVAVEDGVSGFIASTPSEWARAIETLADRATSLRMGACARTLAVSEHTPRAWRGVLAHALLAHNGRSSGAAPDLMPLAHEPGASRATPLGLLPGLRLAGKHLRASSTYATSEDAEALVREAAALPRNGRDLERAGVPVGVVLVDREHPVADLDTSAGTVSFSAGRGAHMTVACGHDDAALQLPSVTVPARADVLVLEARARSERTSPNLKLYWASEDAAAFSDEHSLCVPLQADDAWHAYAAVLPRAVPTGRRVSLRLDPLDAPGEVELGTVAIASRSGERPAPAELRRGVATRFLAGHGLEIGALQNPLPLPPAASARYVDRLTAAQARAHYPELDGQPLVEPSVICEADRLTPVPSRSEDFVVCNHVLEHMRDPLGALREWLRVLRPGGHLYVAVPDALNPLDRHRHATTFEHLLADSRGARPDEDRAHFSDWTASVHRQLSPDARADHASELEAKGYSIHFHVFDRPLFERVLQYACSDAAADLVEFMESPKEDGVEYVAVLRKRGEDITQRPVDIVVPIYNARAYTRACVRSVLRHATGDWRLVLVNDASTEPGIEDDLGEFARADSRVVVLQKEVNAGFVAAANLGMRHANGRDVLLLNSDTEVFEGFLDRMRAAIADDPQTGILTPFSNNATICSIPDFPRDNPVPEGYAPERFARLVAACSRRVRPELPTGVGFCMWIRADVFERVGYFDEETFGRGYGEENDLCLRARKAGFTVRLCDDVFVYHKGKASFGDEGKQLESLAGSNAQRLERKHPGYHAEIARFIESNPLAPLHAVIRFHVPRLRDGAERALLFLLHMSPWRERPGGTEYHVKDLLRELRLPRAVVAWPEGGAVHAAEVLRGNVDEPVRYTFSAGIGGPLAMESALRRAIDLLGISAAHVHHLMSWPYGITRALQDAGVPWVWTHHDYYAVCPNWNLYDYTRRAPCECEHAADPCLVAFQKATGALSGLDAGEERRRHRERMDRACAAASVHLFPSCAAREVFEQHLGTGGPPRRVIEHGYDAAPSTPPAAPGPLLRVAIAGEVAYPIKGSEHYLELLARTRDLPLEWHVFGDSKPFGFEERLRGIVPAERLVLHGRYARHELPDLLRREGIDLTIMLPGWHETFSYVLSEVLVAGIPALVSAHGALRERISRHGAGRAVSSVDDAAGELAALAADRGRLATWTEKARGFVHRTVAESAAEHRRLYEELGWLRDVPLEPWDSARLHALHALATAACTAHGGSAGSRLLRTGSTAARRRPLLHPSIDMLRALSSLRSVSLRPSRATWHSLSALRRAPWSIELAALTPEAHMLLHVKPFDPAPFRAVRFLVRHDLPDGAYAQLYWSHSDAEDFSELKSAHVALGPGGGGWRRYRIRFENPALRSAWRGGPRIVKLRFDPVNVAGRLELGPIVLET